MNKYMKLIQLNISNKYINCFFPIIINNNGDYEFSLEDIFPQSVDVIFFFLLSR